VLLMNSPFSCPDRPCIVSDSFLRVDIYCNLIALIIYSLTPHLLQLHASLDQADIFDRHVHSRGEATWSLGWHRSCGSAVSCIAWAWRSFAPLLPTAFAFLAGNERCEWGLWILSAALVSVGLWPQRSRISGRFVVLWGVALVAGAVGPLLDLELVRQLSFVVLIIVQLCLLGQRVRAHREICDCHASGATCCPAEKTGDSFDSEANYR
jgi:hypothetical protein